MNHVQNNLILPALKISAQGKLVNLVFPVAKFL